MECPVCKKVIKGPSEKCVFCGYIYSKEIYAKLSLYFDLKNELERRKKKGQATLRADEEKRE
ncbi:MAG: hypothetical protein A2Z47_08140 [Thermodesulfovibrio sp. RBG_19FT_COMBO_42_12]|nr:MAG: hypothetical protein A2Z47_08140 [Thermodesulfovibrio sp. RBG_19FT_COMBO_42_12]